MSVSKGNSDKLRQHGLITADPLPPEYEAVVQNLDPHHVDHLIKLKEDLDKAEAQIGGQGPKLSECFIPL